MTEQYDQDAHATDIAIVGMACRFSDCANVESFWQHLRDGQEGIHRYTDEELIAAGVDPALVADPNYVKAGGHLDDMEHFDAGFFGLSPKDAAIMDPQHRNFYECSWEALERAGHTARNFRGAIGMYAGCGMNAYFMRNIMTNADLVRSTGTFLLRHTGNDRDFMPTGVSYKMNLRGPSVAVQTACSTSLVATHMACQSLLNGECDMAFAGGSTIDVPHRHGYIYKPNEILSPDGHCRSFDAKSAGTVLTSGVGVVVLRRLEDALEDGDYIHAVIRGSAINNDGSGKVGFLAPSVQGHAEVVAEALALAGLTADDISYLEAHGTGTSVGDPIEITALTEAYRRTTERTGFCPIGSVKSVIGHTDTAAGAAGLIKVTQSLKNRQIPASLNYESPNPSIDFDATPFYVNAELQDWTTDGMPRRAGISSLGVGGTNAHVIVEEAPAPTPSDAAADKELLVLSAKTPSALDTMTTNLAAHLKANPDLNLSDVAYTLQMGREPFEYRRAIAAKSVAHAAELLEQADPQKLAGGQATGSTPSIVFMFPGGGAQYPNMGRGLYDTEPLYRDTVDECLRLLAPHIDFDLKALMYPPVGEEEQAAEKLKGITASICGIFITEYATAKLWMSQGIEPVAMTGHSLGEYAAACIAGVFSLADALKIVALRGKVMHQVPGAAMLSVALPEAEVRELIGDEMDLAAINGPSLCLVSGMSEQLNALEATLAERDVDCRRLLLAAASHCRLLDPVLDEFRAGIRQVKLNPPQMRYISNVTGTWVDPVDAQDPDYWVRHFRRPVQFSQGLAELLGDPNRIMLEVGPGHTMCSLTRQQPQSPAGIVPSLRHPNEVDDDALYFLTSLGRMWCAGLDIDWTERRGEQRRQRLMLPTYPFERQRYWIEPGASMATESIPNAAIRKIESIDEWFTKPVWTPAPRPVAGETPKGRITLLFADTAGYGAEIADRLQQRGERVIVVREGDAFYRFNENEYALAAEEGREGYDALLADLSEHDSMPHRVIHGWMITADESFRPGSSFFHRNQERGYYSLVFLAQALGELDHQDDLHIDLLSNGMQAVGDETLAYPDKSTLLGPVKVIPHEFAHITCRSVDVALPADDAGDDLRTLFVDELLAECETKPANAIVALRDGQRFTRNFAPVTLPAADASSRLRDQGVYLITGGMGGIGLSLAEHLAEKHQARLILLSRTALPDRKLWDEWLHTHGERDATCRRIGIIRRLESLGAEVLPASGDVANIERMQAVIAEAERQFGTINGVFHAAAVLEDGVILAKTVEAMERVFTPKVHGTLLLADLFRSVPLDFFMLFSSTSSILGPAGQVDYTAANCFLNALAQRERGRGENRFVAINWGVWKGAGAGHEISRRMRGEDVDGDWQHRLVDHPLLDECLAETRDQYVYSTLMNPADRWILDDHRTGDGQAVFPGTGYVELIRAALAEGAGASEFELRDLTFLAPLSIDDDASREVRVTLNRDGERFEVEVTSRPCVDGRSSGDWTLHAQGVANLGAETRAQRLVLDDIRARCRREAKPDADGVIQTRQAELLRFGPRWQVIKTLNYGDGEALARLELPGNFAADLDKYLLHPALVDLGTGCGLPLLDGYDTDDALFVPLVYERLRFRRAMPRTIYSHIRLDPAAKAGDEVVRFDVTITDERGEVLAEMDRFTNKRLSKSAAFGASPASVGSAHLHNAHPANLSEGESLFLETLEAGIELDEGMMVIDRVLAHDAPAQVIASSVDLPSLLQRTDALSAAPADEGVKFDRPNLASTFEAPRDQIEKTLAGIWEELLGVNEIGIHDDFFALGGHSLIAVRLFAKIKKTWSVDYPISVLFQAPTIATEADMIRGELGVGLGDEPAPVAKKEAGFRALVPMNRVESKENKPFFLVAGMFGNVLNLRHLAAHLGDDQPVYAIQARGLHGDEKPHNRFADMARDGIEAMRSIQPEGPYFIGGFSGGGITAYEMAQQLKAEGDSIGILVMLDTPAKEQPTLSRLDRLMVQWLKFKQQGPSYLTSWVKNRIAWEKQKRTTTTRDVTPAEFRSEEIEIGFRTALAHYQTQPFDGKVFLYRPPLEEAQRLSGGRIINSYRDVMDHHNHWKPFVKGGIEVHVVSGDHDGMVLEPHVRVLAGKLKAHIVEAQREARETVDEIQPSRREERRDDASVPAAQSS